MIRRRDLVIYGVALLFSAAAHAGLLGGVSHLARTAPRERPRVLEVAVLQPKAQPPPAPVEEKPKPKPPPPKPVDLTKTKIEPRELPPPPNVSDGEQPAEKAKPVFGISMSSVVGPGKGSGFTVRVGNTVMKDPEAELTPPEEVQAYKPVPLHQVSKPPRTRDGPCDEPPYPPRAKELGIEGRVQLGVEIRSDGSVGAVEVLSGLGHGLDEAAIASMKKCAFVPAEINGHAVGTTITYVFTFVIEG